MSKIFGIGLPKTGTRSLANALSTLGYLTHHNPRTHWGCLYAGCPLPEPFDALVHFGFNQYRRLLRDYPEAKFILTVRDLTSWLASCQGQFAFFDAQNLMQERLRLDTFGTVGFDPLLFTQTHDLHTHGVMQFFNELEANQKLVYDICGGAGWEPLCEFLGHAVPKTAFPHDNNNKAMREYAKQRAEQTGQTVVVHK